MAPRAKTAIWVRAPPEKRLRTPTTPPWAAVRWTCWTAPKSTHGPGELAPSQHLHQTVLVHQSLAAKGVGRHLVAVEGLEDVEVHDRVLHPEGVLEALQLGNAAAEGHLAPFEPRLDGVAGPLALHAPPGGLAALAGDASADPPL